ncbi:hypothetical protein [Flexibacterium corallicola]|uniref:hypothetical protein n=1 Tax=Flexibacterium corallicola TaxID=3037259 RepID=UPI00286F7319|nr:hypothetical protein [Pseudovibrio sp. M1P-2-3]
MGSTVHTLIEKQDLICLEALGYAPAQASVKTPRIAFCATFDNRGGGAVHHCQRMDVGPLMHVIREQANEVRLALLSCRDQIAGGRLPQLQDI